MADSFATKLIRWQQQYGRHDLPWQNMRDAYAIWISEIMLQQTQVSTVIPYYRRFMQRFPNIQSLASASLDDVLALWSGLGYYSRGRNLHKAARLIVTEHQGIFPEDIGMIRQLPGIGRSTAAAVAVFAFGRRSAILDGNVKRILSRYFGIEGYPGEKQNETLLWRKAEELLPQFDGNQIDENQFKDPAEVYTQALMDLGATVCTRSKPKCHSCPLVVDCIALRDNKVDRLPAPRPRKPLSEKETALLVLIKQGQILLEKRPAPGIWGGLWCLPEMPVGKNAAEHCMNLGMEVQPLAVELESFDHAFTHFKLRIHPKPLKVVSYSSCLLPARAGGNESIWIAIDEALKAAIPSPVRKLLMQFCCHDICPQIASATQVCIHSKPGKKNE